MRPAIGALAITLLCSSACGSSVADSSSTASGGLGTGGGGGTAGTAGAGGEVAEYPGPDANELRCGDSVCTVPGQVCCYESAFADPGTDQCVADGTCMAPNRACDETADCPSGSVCCSGLGVLPLGSPLDGFVATNCVQIGAPNDCLPEPGVGKSSAQVCKVDAECVNGEACVVEACHGNAIATCGGSVDCE
jgi:hypothetical protein